MKGNGVRNYMSPRPRATDNRLGDVTSEGRQ